MRSTALLIGLIAASLGTLPARAFQEMPEPPPVDSPAAPPQSNALPDALQLGTPEGAAGPLTEQEGGINIFGYTLLPKLNLGLDVLYGQDQQQQQQQMELQSPSTLDDNNDVTVLGRINRRF
jgi:hypothetical protein